MATLYYNAAVDNDWNTLGNWWQDEGFTVPATALPTSSDDVVLSAINDGDEVNNSGPDAVANSVTGASSPFVRISMNLTCSVFGLYAAVGPTGTVNIVDGTLPAEYGFLPGPRAVFDTWNEGTINGNCTFYMSNNYPNAVINGDCNFINIAHNYGTVNGNATFDATSEMAGGSGVVIGDATFAREGEYTGYDLYWMIGTVSGVRTFTGNNVSFKLNGSDSWTYDTTNWAFPNCVPFWSFYDSSNSGVDGSGLTITGNCTFHDNSQNWQSITGNATFHDNSQNYGGTVSGVATFRDYSSAVVNTTCGWYGMWNEAHFYDFSHCEYGNAGATFHDSSYNSGTINGDCAFDGESYNSSAGTITGDCTFHYYSFNNGTITGACTFYDYSRQYQYGIIYGACTLHDSSYNNGTINGDCNFYDGASNGNLYYASSGTITGDCTFHDSSYNNGYITGDCTFNDSSSNKSYVYGDATFNDTSYMNVTSINNPLCCVYGNATFNEGSWNGADGFVSLSATFNGNSLNAGTIGDGSTPALATFNDNAINGYIHWIDRTQENAAQFAGRIRGDAVFRGNSRNDVNVTGTVTLAYDKGINGSSILGII